MIQGTGSPPPVLSSVSHYGTSLVSILPLCPREMMEGGSSFPCQKSTELTYLHIPTLNKENT